MSIANNGTDVHQDHAVSNERRKNEVTDQACANSATNSQIGIITADSITAPNFTEREMKPKPQLIVPSTQKTEGALDERVYGSAYLPTIPGMPIKDYVKFAEAFRKFDQELPRIKPAKKLVEQSFTLPKVVVSGLLHQGSKMVLGGGSKSYKTWCLIDLAVSVACGVPWWGLETSKGRVLYMNFEIQEGFFARRLDNISSAKGCDIDSLEGLDVWNLRGFCTDLSKLMMLLLEKIQKGYYSLIIVDPIYKGMGDRDENAAGDINGLLNEIERLTVQTGAAVVFGAHFSKGNQAAKESIDRISGSGVFARDPDSILIMTPHENENTFTIEPTLRNFAPMESFCVQWNPPLMQRDDECDPKNLKQPNKKGEKFTSYQLFEILNVQQLTTAEWEKQSCERTTMKPRTFAMKKKELVEAGSVKQIADGKWKAVNPVYPPGWNAAREKDKEVQQGAIAPCCSE